MPLVFNTKTYTADSFASDSVGYIGAAKTVSAKDDLTMRRSKPKPSAVSSGVGRTFAKLQRTVNLTGALTPTGLISVETIVYAPVGVASADVDAVLNDHGALVSSADMKSHVKLQKISF
ncbi:coat protein [ssRNA phage SRR7976299_16]|uniref:Coat protein n=1 Tax=ssRNA phage SRR7976299_16 TaxID=2786638 RepID=A0A8S5L531_9VIRU|nr:coat protein [ssRNA phage SRR7976299_16]DAD52659.1 TPA_asm: coat protein [ssRNA phage SRR7976299_16]